LIVFRRKRKELISLPIFPIGTISGAGEIFLWGKNLSESAGFRTQVPCGFIITEEFW